MDYQFKDIEKKWQRFWAENETFKAENNSAKPKYYVLDMFPYPSGAGLHVGHPLGYIASDIFARYKRLKGFNVLHPMGYDSFGLPAEQYAIQTGQHPAITTETNIATYRRQLDQLGFSFDWSREVRTSSPEYYKWTQWIFMQLFDSWYNNNTDKAEQIDTLIAHFEENGSAGVNAACDDDTLSFSAPEWEAMPDYDRQTELLKYRLTYLRESTVNWCPALGTVLANDEVKDGFSERGGFPVEQKKMMQWSMRITAYAGRLLSGLDTIDWPEPLKEMQRNWIGKSVGALVKFRVSDFGFRNDEKSEIENSKSEIIEVFTTRVDTIFGATFLVLAPEHELVPALTTPEQKKTIEKYIAQSKKKSELERLAEAKVVSGAFTGSYAINPVNEEKIPIWIADYVLAGYGTGAVMAVPSGDQRDYLFAKQYQLPIIPIIDIQNIDNEADPTKEGRYINSGFINGMTYKEATAALIAKLDEVGAGKGKVNYRMRDAIFGRQRYWGEPVPVYFKDGLPQLINEQDLPLVLPEITLYKPTETGEPPLARSENWKYIPVTSNKFNKFFIKSPTRNLNFESIEKHYIEYLSHLLGSKYKMQTEVRLGQFRPDLFISHDNFAIAIEINFDNSKTSKILEEYLKHFHVHFLEIKASQFHKKGFEKKLLSSIEDLQYRPQLIWAEKWTYKNEYNYELSTMPGWAGSSWYWYRYMDAHNNKVFASNKAITYWKDVDLYIGGSEHATGHLLYSRFWNKFLRDAGLVVEEEPFKKLINQGMIQGRSNLVYKLNIDYLIDLDIFNDKVPQVFVSKSIKDRIINIGLNANEIKFLRDKYFELNSFWPVPHFVSISEIHVDVNIVNNDILDIEKFRKWRPELVDAYLILDDGTISYPTLTLKSGSYICGVEIEKMSKSKYNVVNPDVLVERYGADTLRMYEMFLGPLEQSKPWNTNGIEGVFKFLRKFWKLFHDDKFKFSVSDAEPSKQELKSLHKIIRKVEEDVERFSFNTSVSSFMIAVNELTDLKCSNKAVLTDLVIVLSPYAPHICEELWTMLGNKAGTLSYVAYPKFNPEYLIEDDFAYPISVNGKTRMNLNIPLSFESSAVEAFVLDNADVQKYINHQAPKKVIVVKGRIVNIVI